MGLVEAIEIAMSDEAQEIYTKEGKKGLEKFLKKDEGISKKKRGGRIRGDGIAVRGKTKGTIR